jgi:uncharacterized protein YukE
MAPSLAVPGGDPAVLELQAGRLKFAAQGAVGLSRSTGRFTAATQSDAVWTGQSAGSFDAFGTNLAKGADAAAAPLTRIATAVETFAGPLRTAQQRVAAYNVIATAAAGDRSGSLVSAREKARQNAVDALKALQEAGSQAAAEVSSATADLQDLFGIGPVQGFISAHPGLGADLPVDGWQPTRAATDGERGVRGSP